MARETTTDTTQKPILSESSALVRRFLDAAKPRADDLFGTCAARLMRAAYDGYLGETAAWNNVADVIRELAFCPMCKGQGTVRNARGTYDECALCYSPNSELDKPSSHKQ